MMENPRILAFTIVNDCMAVGSSTDGLGAANEGWKERSSSYHWGKALGHLATHIKQKMCGINDPNGEHHGELAMVRCSMALAVEKHELQNQQHKSDN